MLSTLARSGGDRLVVTTTKSDHLLLHFFVVLPSFAPFCVITGYEYADCSLRGSLLEPSLIQGCVEHVSTLNERTGEHGCPWAKNGPEANGVLLDLLTLRQRST
jgi:hypothetical protein